LNRKSDGIFQISKNQSDLHSRFIGIKMLLHLQYGNFKWTVAAVIMGFIAWRISVNMVESTSIAPIC